MTIDFSIHLNRTAPESIAQQLIVQIRTAILQSQLVPGAKLPSTRLLARVLGISRTTVLTAYDELLIEGYLVGKSGSGTFVSQDLPHELRPPPVNAPMNSPRWLRIPMAVADVDGGAPDGKIEFRVGQPAVTLLSSDAWVRAWRRVASVGLPNRYMDAAGDPGLRNVIAGYLRRTRGLVCDADDVIITTGAIQGLHLIARATLGVGDRVAFEEPGYRLARQIFLEHAATIVPISVDGDGLRVTELPTGPNAPPLVYVTPSHQFPLGSRLSLPRRQRLLDWAAVHDCLIIEDDYDGEFRYDTAPLPALAALDSQRVAYLGTFSKVLSPALRVGYVVAPKALIAPLIALKTIADYHTSWPIQRVLAYFLEAGDLERHLRRMRRLYSRKRALLVQTLAPISDWARVGGLEAGFHIHLELAPSVDAESVVRLAWQQGVAVQKLSPFYYSQTPQNGLLLGYGDLEPAQIIAGATVLVAVISSLVGNV